MKAYRGITGVALLFLISVLDAGQLSASHPSYFTPVEKTPWYLLIGGWLGSEPLWTFWRGENSLACARN
jgi:uncharacterized membrane protein YdcZ (DUF606 family)